VFWREADSLGIQQNAQRGHDVLEIQQRLALTHENDIGLRRERAFLFFEDEEHLRDDFACREIAHQPQPRRQAKPALDGAASLGGDADRLAAFAGHENGFHGSGARGEFFTPGWELKEIAGRAVAGAIALLNFGQGDSRFLGELLAEGYRQIAHRREVELPLRIERVIDLVAAVSWLAELRTELAQFLPGLG
jgi:hypothetical protein